MDTQPGKTSRRLATAVLLGALCVSGCGNGGGSSDPMSYTITASVTGLANVTGLVLQDNGSDNLAVSSGGSYAFQTPIPGGATYSVTILTQPAGHTCIVQNGSGTVGASNVTVSVVCPHDLLFSMGSGVGEFYIDDATGSLVPVSGVSCAGTSIVLAPGGKFAYVTSGASLSACAIDPTSGAATTIAGSSQAAGGGIAISPNGGLVLVVSSGKVSSFSVNTSTGALTPAAVRQRRSRAGL